MRGLTCAWAFAEIVKPELMGPHGGVYSYHLNWIKGGKERRVWICSPKPQILPLPCPSLTSVLVPRAEQCLSGCCLEYTGPGYYGDLCEAESPVCCLPGISVVPALVLSRTLWNGGNLKALLPSGVSVWLMHR